MPYSKILLIDDDEDDQEIFLAALVEVSSQLTFVARNDASGALRELESKSLTPELIFLDLNMPIMTGHQFLKEIKAREDLKNIPVIIFSTTSHPGTIKMSKELGALDFITKPSNLDDLVEILRTVV